MRLVIPKTLLKGFSVLELMISLSIIGIMTTALFVRYPETIKRLTLASVTNTLAITIHEAQVRGSAIDSVNNSIGGYGVYFSLNTPDQIILFGDNNSTDSPYNGKMSRYQLPIGDGVYETLTNNEEMISKITFPNGFVIGKICQGVQSNTTFNFNCDSTIHSLAISFSRPNPQPNIYFNNTASTTGDAVCIELQPVPPSIDGHSRSVQVYSSGIIRKLSYGCNS